MRNIVSPQIQFLVPYNISHAYHLLIRIYFPRLPLYNLWILHFHTPNSIIPNISSVIDCSISYFV